MSLVQSLVRRFLSPASFAALEASSRQWMMRCLTCGAEWSYWEAGGIRGGGVSKGKRMFVKCEKCRRHRCVKVYRQSDAAPTKATHDEIAK